MHAGYHNRWGEVVLSRRLVARRYAHGWLAPDVVSSLPYAVINRVLPESVPLGAFIALRMLPLLRLPRAFRNLLKCAFLHPRPQPFGRDAASGGLVAARGSSSFRQSWCCSSVVWLPTRIRGPAALSSSEVRMAALTFSYLLRGETRALGQL